MQKWIYHFNSNISSSNKIYAKEILGGKGANLSEMSELKFPVPPGFTISSEVCQYYYENNQLPPEFLPALEEAMQLLENNIGKNFGSATNPLLVAVRSGAKDSMPGMMDTILNLGMNDVVYASILQKTNDARFAFDIYRRFLTMYGTTVLGISRYLFEDIFEKYKINPRLQNIEHLDESNFENILQNYKNIFLEHQGKPLTQEPKVQLITSIEAIIKSWMSPRAITYRKINKISNSLGTAVNIQSMVFGNMGQDSATGVVFSRDPINGTKNIFGEFLINAQGEDIVSGSRTPDPIRGKEIDNSMENLMPDLFASISEICGQLELYYKDMQDIEFTIEQGKLYILQTRSAKRSIAAAIKVAVDMAEEGIITKEEAIMKIKPDALNQLLHSSVDYSVKIPPEPIASGLAASPGAASGKVVFSSAEAEEVYHYHNIILVRNDTSPEDIHGMHIAKGILTARGGMTSHAAVVARGMGKPCVCGATSIKVSEENKLLTIGALQIKAGDEITIDGDNGKIFLGKIALNQPAFSLEYAVLLKWADEINGMEVRANAETIADTGTALSFGAKGIGLCRTEHMFFDKDKIFLMQEMIVVQDIAGRQRALQKLLPLHKQDFKNLFNLLKNKPINIRLLDPPLHEFLPKTHNEQETLARQLGISLELMQHRLELLHEINPMLGHRGCRLGITYPEIYKMQLEAIFHAAKEIFEEENINVQLEIMVPLICNDKEIEVISLYFDEFKNLYNKFSFGTMIELPRSALIADKLAKNIDFISFGTNDLTQTTYGISRDDIASFLPLYLNQEIFSNDPFMVLDKEGVGELIKIAIQKAKLVNPKIKFGICGEHGGNAESIDFFQEVGINYVSCSPFRIPNARLAVAQSKINSLKKYKIDNDRIK